MSESKNLEFKKVRDFGQKFNATFEFLRQEFKPLLNAILYISGPLIVLGSIMGAFYQRNSLSLMDITTFSEEILANDIIISALVMVVFSIAAYIFIFATLNEYVLQYLKTGTQVRTQEVWTNVKANLTRYIGSALGIFLLTVGISFALALLMALFISADVLLLNFVLIIALFFGIFFFSVLTYIAYIAINSEDLGLFDGIRRSVELLKNNWFATLGLMIVGTLLVSLLGVIFSLPNAIMTSIGVLHAIDNPDGMNISLTQELLFGFTGFIASAGGFFLSVITMLLMVFQYYSLVEERDATGLLDRIDSLGESQTEQDEEHF